MAIALLLGFAMPSWASSDAASATDRLPEVAPPAIEDSISDAELQDLQTVADQRGISLEEAIERYAWRDNFALAAQMIGETTPEAFTGAEIVDAGNAWIGFAGEVPREALEELDLFAASHGDVSVEVRTHLGFTETELLRAIEGVHYALLARSEVRQAATTFDFATKQITTRVVLADTVPASAIEELRLVATNSLIDAVGEGILDSIATAVVRSDLRTMGGGDDSSAYHMGGETLSTCTSGFAVFYGSMRGISTAAHCNNTQYDDGASLTFQSEHNGTYGDFQWHTGPQAEIDDFYSGNATTTEVNARDVSSVGAPTVGLTLCLNGMTTHKHCADVRKVGVCYGGRCNLVQMGTREAAGGDSGGPWFWGNTAYGLHQSWMYDPVWPFDRDLFSRADLIDNALGIYIATS